MKTKGKAFWRPTFGAVVLAAVLAVVAIAGPAVAGTAEHLSPAGAAPVRMLERVALVVDATDSVDAEMPGGMTRRDAYLAATRAIIRAVQRASLRLTLARTCGLTEVLWDAPVTRKDFAPLTALIESVLKSCDGRTSAVRSARRAAGTDLIDGLRWLARQPDTALLAYITDGLNTLSSSGSSPSEEFLRALDRLPAAVRRRLWIVGVDEAVRDAVGSRVSRSSGLFDLQSTAGQLTDVIRRKEK